MASIPAQKQNIVAGTGTTYRGVSADVAMQHSIHYTWDATFVGTFTLEASSLEDALIDSIVAGQWLGPYNPGTAYIPALVGGTNVGTTITVPGGTAGGCLIELPASAARRLRSKVVCTTGGNIAIQTHGKA